MSGVILGPSPCCVCLRLLFAQSVSVCLFTASLAGKLADSPMMEGEQLNSFMDGVKFLSFLKVE